MKSRTQISEKRSIGTISSSSIRNLLHKSISVMPTKTRSNLQNTPPIHPNILQQPPFHNTALSPSLPKPTISHSQIPKLDHHPQPQADPSVKVLARIRPDNGHGGGHQTVRKVSDDSVFVRDRKFAFDLVFDSNSSQEDVFRLVGVPLVKDALAGYNTSLMAYGQTGSGKTYTMWGPQSAMVEGHSASNLQGIVPRVFQMLFSEIQREQENGEGKQINYQCRCSFLEIYNEQIGDLLDPTQRNLEIRDDAKNGFYVENLTEEYVTSYEDVTQILIKGLSSRKVGATSINSKSSRSHIVFTFIIESWCKETSSKCFGSSKTSRINLVDLAGLERNGLDDAGRQSVKEGKYIKKSISQLGHLVNILAKITQSGKPESVPYTKSRLTHLLRESLGGNAKLTVICAVSPDNKCNSETLSTLRFGQQAKLIWNKPVINEITEDDVNDLSDKIRQLKEELIRAKSDVCNSSVSNYGYSKEQSIRESVNQLRLSLNRSLILPRIENESEEDVHIDENDVRDLCLQLDDNFHSSHEEKSNDTSDGKDCNQFFSLECCETDLTSENYISFSEESDHEEINSKEPQTELPHQNNIVSVSELASLPHNPDFRSNISITACLRSAVLQDPTLSESPKIRNTGRNSISISSNLENQDNMLESSKFNTDVLSRSLKENDHVRSSLQSSKIFPGPTESLAASLQRGLQIIDYHQRNSVSNKSSVSFSFGHLTLKPSPTVDTANAHVQTLPDERRSSDGPSASFLCTSCQKRVLGASNEVRNSLKTSVAATNESGSPNEFADQVTEDEVKDWAEAIKREKELESVCKEQAAQIQQLNHLVEQYKHEREQKVINECSNDHHLENLKNEEVQTTDELEYEKNYMLKHENKLLRWNDSENHEPEIIKEKCEIKEVREESTSLDVNEKETLLKEIEGLRGKLQSYTDIAPPRSIERLRSSLLSRSIQLRKSDANPPSNGEDEIEKERQRWMEMESDWISLTDELRIDLESNRRRAEKVEMELRFEKKCTEELDDALKRSVLGHARMVEHYAELQEKYNDLVAKHRSIMEGIAEVKRAAAKAGAKGRGSRFAKSLAAELSALRVEREREREILKKENRSLRIQLRDAAEAVHAAGEVLVRLREAEQSASVAEENFAEVQEENEKLKNQMEKLKRKHKMEMITMKQYLAGSRLPEAALRPLYREDSDIAHNDTKPLPDDDQAWRAEFGAIYQEHY